MISLQGYVSKDGIINVRANFPEDKDHKKRHMLDRWESGGNIWYTTCGRWGTTHGDLVKHPSSPYPLCPECFPEES